jgi:hypothetical protein
VAQSIGNNSGLQDWTDTLFSIPINGKNATGLTSVTRVKSVNEELKKELLKILLEVYMSDKLVFSSCFDIMNVEGLNVILLGRPIAQLTY